MTNVSKQEVLQFLKSQNGGVLSPVSPEQQPASSFVYFACNEDFNIYFIMSKLSKKYVNIKSNNKVSFVVIDEQNLITVQGLGIANEIKDEEESRRVYDLLIQILNKKIENWPPPFAKMADAKLVIMKIKFTSLRWGDFRYSATAPMEEFYTQIL